MKCLQRLEGTRQITEGYRYEVIVSDDSANGEAKKISAKFPWVTFVEGPRRGPASNRNNGTRLAAGNWLVFTDDDCLPEPGWLQAYADAIRQNPESKAFEGAILPDDPKLLKKDMSECPVNENGGCFWSANIAVERTLFYQVGQFDEQFTIAAMEDKDLYNRLKKATVPVFVKNAVVIHPVRVVSLFWKIKRLPASFSNYKKYLNTLHPQEKARAICKSRKNHFYAAALHLKSGKPRWAFYHLMALGRYVWPFNW